MKAVVGVMLGLAVYLAAGAAPAADALRPAASDWRDVDPDNTLVIDTNKGRIIVELTPLAAPQAVDRVKQLIRQHFYDGLTFFRVVDDFMAQTGDPQNSGKGGSTLPNIPGEFGFRHKPGGGFAPVTHMPGAEGGFIGVLPVASQPMDLAMLTNDGAVDGFGIFCAGVMGMARAQGDDTANSQFFLMRQDYLSLDQHYAALGRVVVGLDVVRALKTGEPVDPPQDQMLHVNILADMPEKTRPKVKVIDTKSAYFQALAAQVRERQGDGFSPCSLDVAAKAQ